MNCKQVTDQLSLFLDEMLENDSAIKISQHLAQCPACRAECDRLAELRRSLKSLGRVSTPEFLGDLVKIRIEEARKGTWKAELQEAWEYRWSRIRTTERMWYLTRVMGTAVTLVLFFALYASMNPYLNLSHDVLARNAVSQTLRLNLLNNLGLTPLEAQKKPISPRNPKINDLNLVIFGQNSVRSAHDDTVSVVTVVDRNGSAKIQDVLDYPSDTSLLSDFTDMIMSARWRPASLNGRAVDSHLVLTFSKVYVYN